MTKIAVLGCGPSALLAVYAAETCGVEADIYSLKQKSQIGGAMYLHEPIDGLTDSAGALVSYQKMGTKFGYAQKVYGAIDADTSWDSFPEGIMPGWSMQVVYDRLWHLYKPRIRDTVVGVPPTTPEALTSALARRYDGVYSTLPAKVLCSNPEHSFESVEIWVRKQKAVIKHPFSVVYNGDPALPWYRYSNLFGLESYEFSHEPDKERCDSVGRPRPKADAEWGYKPLRTNCDCCPNVKRLGRFGKWQRGILVHHAYKEVLGELNAL